MRTLTKIVNSTQSTVALSVAVKNTTFLSPGDQNRCGPQTLTESFVYILSLLHVNQKGWSQSMMPVTPSMVLIKVLISVLKYVAHTSYSMYTI